MLALHLLLAQSSSNRFPNVLVHSPKRCVNGEMCPMFRKEHRQRTFVRNGRLQAALFITITLPWASWLAASCPPPPPTETRITAHARETMMLWLSIASPVCAETDDSAAPNQDKVSKFAADGRLVGSSLTCTWPQLVSTVGISYP